MYHRALSKRPGTIGMLTPSTEAMPSQSAMTTSGRRPREIRYAFNQFIAVCSSRGAASARFCSTGGMVRFSDERRARQCSLAGRAVPKPGSRTAGCRRRHPWGQRTPNASKCRRRPFAGRARRMGNGSPHDCRLALTMLNWPIVGSIRGAEGIQAITRAVSVSAEPWSGRSRATPLRPGPR